MRWVILIWCGLCEVRRLVQIKVVGVNFGCLLGRLCQNSFWIMMLLCGLWCQWLCISRLVGSLGVGVLMQSISDLGLWILLGRVCFLLIVIVSLLGVDYVWILLLVIRSLLVWFRFFGQVVVYRFSSLLVCISLWWELRCLKKLVVCNVFIVFLVILIEMLVFVVIVCSGVLISCGVLSSMQIICVCLGVNGLCGLLLCSLLLRVFGCVDIVDCWLCMLMSRLFWCCK